MPARSPWPMAVLLGGLAHGAWSATPCSIRQGIPKPGLDLSTGKAYALIIGLDDYNDPLTQNLDYCESNARGMESLLAKQGYTTVLCTGENATRTAIMGGFEHIEKQLAVTGRNGRVLFFISAHGNAGPDPDFRQSGFYLQLRNEFGRQTHLYFSEISERIARCRAKQQIAFVEACFSGQSGIPLLKASPFYHPQLLDNNVFLLSAWDSRIEQGLYGEFLLRALAGAADGKNTGNGDSLVEAPEIIRYINREIRAHRFDANANYHARFAFIGRGRQVLADWKAKPN